MVRDTIQLEDAISTISQEYLLEFTSEYGIPESLYHELPGRGTHRRRENIPHRRRMAHKRPKGWDAIDRLLFRDGRNDIEYTPYPYPKATGSCIMPSRTESELLSGGRHMDLFNLITAPNPTKVKTGTRPRPTHEVPLLNGTASRVIDIEDTTVASGSSETPPAIEKSPLDFANEDTPPLITERDGTEAQVQDGLSREIPPVENPTTTKVILEPDLEKEVAAMGPLANKRRRKKGNDEADANAPPKVLRKDHVASRPAQSTLRGKSLASIGLEAGSTFVTPATQDTPADAKSVSDPDLLSYAQPQPHPERDVAHHTNKSHVSHNMNAGLPEGRPPISPPNFCKESGVREIGLLLFRGRVARRYLPARVGRDQQLPPGHPGRVPRHGRSRSTDGVAMGSQLRLKFEQKVRLLKKATAKIAKWDQRIKAREEEIKKLDQEIKSLRTVETEVHGLHNQTKNLETLLEAEVDMKKATEAKKARLAKELESLHAQFSDLQVSNNQLSQQVEQRCAEMDARLDKLRLVKGMSEGLKHGIEQGKAGRDLATVEAYDPEADSKYVKALQDLKDLKYPLVDQMEGLKDAPMDLIMASFHLESDFEKDAPHWIRDLCPSSSQLKIPIYPEKKCMVVCRTHRIGSTHHARSDGIPVSVPTIAPQGLAILLADVATQTEEEEPHPRLQ
ncbi:hypothetical protein Tco_0846004 [Tanacetum coccineum]